MKVFKSSNRFDEYFEKLPLAIKNKATKRIEELKKFPSVVEPIILEPIKNRKDTYRNHIDKDYYIALEYSREILLLLFVGKEEDDFTR